MKIALFANTDWYLYNFRQSLAQAICDAGHEVILISPPGPYAKKLESLGFRWISAPMKRRSLNPVREFLLLSWLWRLFAREHVDIVHGFTIKCAVYGSIVARLMSTVRKGPSRISAVAGMGYVFTSSDIKARLLRPVVRRFMRFAFNGKDALLVVQNPTDLTFFIQERIVDASLTRLIPGSGVNLQRFSPSPDSSPDPSTRLRVLLPARLLWDKGLAEFIDAARALKSEGASIDFFLAGTSDEGNPASVPRPVIEQWARDGVVAWLGHVEDMPQLFRSVDVVVLPSYREGLPKGLIEAASSGLALITTNVPGCRDVVDDEINGLLIPVRDAVALKQAIARLQTSPELRIRLGMGARDKALRYFGEDTIIQQTIALYSEVKRAGDGIPR